MTKVAAASHGNASSADLDAVAETLRSLRDELRLAAGDDRVIRDDPSAANMRAYLALRRHDNRALQAALARLGLSSLGRSEAHVLATLEQVLAIVERLATDTPTAVPAAAASFDESARSASPTGAGAVWRRTSESRDPHPGHAAE